MTRKRPLTRPIRVLIADDHALVREGLRAVLDNHADIHIIGEAADGEAAVKMARSSRPDVVLMDINMPKMSGLEAAAVLTKKVPETKTLILSMHYDRSFIRQMMGSGAKGYILKDSTSREVVEAIRDIHAGKTHCSALISEAITREALEGRGEVPEVGYGSLTPREREVLVAVAEGHSNKEIALQFGVGVRTVESHRERLMDKLDIHNTAGLTRFAIKSGLIAAK